MTDLNNQNGSRIAAALPLSAETVDPSRTNVESLADLLACLNSKPTSQTPMFRSAAGKIALFLAKPIDQISLDSIHANREGFRPFLESLRHKEGAVRSYVNYLRMLLDAAGDLGWKPHVRVSKEWQAFLDQAKRNLCLTITKSLMQTKQSPEHITQDDLDRWVALRVKQGMRYVSAHASVVRVWRTLIDCGHVKNVPIAFLRQKNYGIPFSKFPSPLKEEVAELLRWKSAECEPGRPNRARIRKVSADCVQQTFSSLFGFALNIRQIGGVSSLVDLIQEHILKAYISWCKNDRKMRGTPLITSLAAVVAAVSQHPDHKGMDLGWYRPLLESIPRDSYEVIKARKATKYLDYDVLERIPVQIHAERTSTGKRGQERLARLAMEELMIAWPLVLPWRQRNLRECRVEGPNKNLFKAKVPFYSYIDIPEWAQREEAKNPEAEFWQIRFSEEETKTGIAVHSLLPRSLVELLEEYMFKYRPLLLKGRQCETLFVPPEADELKSSFVTDTISDLTLRYGGRRVTPHLIRDIVAYAWLKSHKGDFLTLSKMLWHKNVQATINIYGSRYNESRAVCAMEVWRAERQRGSEWNPSKAR